MLQGDACNLGIAIVNNAGSPVTPQDVRDIEITIGRISKRYSGVQLRYADGIWMFPLEQYDTFSTWPGSVKAEVRVLWANGVVEGQILHGIRMEESISKEVL